MTPYCVTMADNHDRCSDLVVNLEDNAICLKEGTRLGQVRRKMGKMGREGVEGASCQQRDPNEDFSHS